MTALKELGIKPVSAESVFKDAASGLLANDATRHQNVSTLDKRWYEFWRLARDVDVSAAMTTIRECGRAWLDLLRVRTLAGRWCSLFGVLLPGAVVPEDGSRDRAVAIDIKFHQEDLPLLRELGVVDAPRPGHTMSPTTRRRFTDLCREEFKQQDLPRKPQPDKLNFYDTTTSGPMDVLESLTDEGKVLYTWRLLALDDTYKKWTMRHDTQDIYPPMDFESPALEALRRHGRIETEDGVHRLSDGLAAPPKNRSVLDKLLTHPKSALIRQAFGLQEAPPEPIGADEATPLIDVWPGLGPYLEAQSIKLHLIRCDLIRKLSLGGGESELDRFKVDDTIYITRQEVERAELELVLRELRLRLSDNQIVGILLGQLPVNVQQSRQAVRDCNTDEERLLQAVGESELLRRLPQGLIAIFEDSHNGPLSGTQIAQAAISTFHTGALREYRHALNHLDPPKQWAGTQRAVEFVRSLGFSEEWAGYRNTRRDPYVEVEGPYSLPELHGYQRHVVDNVRYLLESNGTDGERRGMVSMPTGSGKTRVAVQAVVEAIREDGFKGGVLWVADRDELCEQAVEAWRQVWASEGTQATQLRISRMWGGQPQPLPTGDMHVIVATIQTLSAKIERQPDSFEFLADFKLLVFDEAHRSIAPTFTTVMQELGFTRWQRQTEPLLIGLTATPYRGVNEEETRRLANRYGSNRLDSGAFADDDPEKVIRELQDMRVLARADHGTIEGDGSPCLTMSYSSQEKPLGCPEVSKTALHSTRTALDESLMRTWDK